MTYQELLALISPQNAYTFNQQTGGGSEGYTSTPTTAPGAYLMDPSNPMGGYVWDGGGGALSSVIPREGGGVDWTQYGAGGQQLGSGFSQDTSGGFDSLLRAGLVLGGGALAGNFLAPALMGGGAAAGGATAAAGAAPAAAPAAAGTTGAATAAGGAMLPMVDDWAANGSLLSTNPAPIGGTGGGMNWQSLLGQGASSLMNNPMLAGAGLGAIAGIAGNGDMNTSQNTSSSNTQSLAPWMQGHAQDFVNRAAQMSYLPQFQTNNALETGRGLLSNTATQGDPLVNAARGQQANVIGGGMLGANPYINGVASDMANIMGDAYATGTRAGTFSTFNNDGNSVLGKSAFRQTLGQNDTNFARALGEQTRGLLNQNYQQERSAQDNASRASLGFGQFGVQNAQNLYGMGQQDFQRPFTSLGFYGQALNPAFGSQTTGTGTQTQNIQAPNNWMAGLGGAALGAGMARSIFPTR